MSLRAEIREPGNLLKAVVTSEEGISHRQTSRMARSILRLLFRKQAFFIAKKGEVK